MNIKCKFRQLRYDIRYVTMRYPLIYFPLTYLGDRGGAIVNKNTDIVIEGFPRSANTFAVNAFRLAQDKKLNIAHHKHSVAQIIRAIYLNIPTLLLIRNPQDAVCSFIIREPCISIKKALQYYLDFYQQLVAYQDNLVIAKFETVTTDYAQVIREVNLKFNTKFQVFNNTEYNVKKCFQSMEKYSKNKSKNGKIIETMIPRPSIERKEATEGLKNKIFSSEFNQLRSQAEQIYCLLLKNAI